MAVCASCPRNPCPRGLFLRCAIRRPGRVRRLARKYHALASGDGKILVSKLRPHYRKFSTGEKRAFNLYDKVLRRIRG